MKLCSCCDHPLEHAISRFAASVPYIGYPQATAALKDDLYEWRVANDEKIAARFTPRLRSCGCEWEAGSWNVCPHHRLPSVGDVLEDEEGWREVSDVVASTEEYGFWTIDREGNERWCDVRPPWRGE